MKVFCIEPLGQHAGMRPLDMGLASALLRGNCNFTWVTNNLTTLPLNGVEVWQAFSRIFGSDASYKRGFRYGLALMKILRRARLARSEMPVVVHQQFVVLPIIDYLFARLVQQSGIPYVCSPHDVIPFVPRMEYLLAAFYKRCSALILNSQYGLQQMKKLIGIVRTPMYTIPLGNMNEYYVGSTVDSATARKALGIRPEQRVLLFAGQIKKEKGLDYLLRALPTVTTHLSDTVLIIAGRPFHNDITQYESLIDSLGVRNSIITRWGYIEEKDLEVLHQAADVVVLPYMKVFQSAACLTAYAFRKPVVAFANGGLVEQVVNGETGYLVQSGDWQALAETLVSLLRNRDYAVNLGRRGYNWVSHVMDWETVVNKTVEVYHDVVRPGCAGPGGSFLSENFPDNRL